MQLLFAAHAHILFSFYYNYLCFFTLVKKEVFRFLKVGIQTVIGPTISSLLFLAVFTLAQEIKMSSQ